MDIIANMEVSKKVIHKAVMIALEVDIDLRLTKLNQKIQGLELGGYSNSYIDNEIKKELTKIRKEIRSESDDKRN